MSPPLDSNQVRHWLGQELRSDSDFNAFCLDYFPTIYARFSSSMDRVQKTNILLEQVVDMDVIVLKLRTTRPDTTEHVGNVPRNWHLLAILFGIVLAVVAVVAGYYLLKRVQHLASTRLGAGLRMPAPSRKVAEHPTADPVTKLDHHPVPVAPAGMVRISAGILAMGSSKDEMESDYQICRLQIGSHCRLEVFQREIPQQLPVKPFFFHRYEVTNREFAAWLSRQESIQVRDLKVFREGQLLIELHSPYSGLAYINDRFVARSGFDDKPVVQVSWHGAASYCQTHGLRLPTEAEWEMAARGMVRRRFPWGDDQPTCSGVVFARADGGLCAALPGGPSTVGSVPQDRTPDMVFDLGGNVAEWTADAFATEAGLRVVRGGSWSEAAVFCRSAGRSRWQQDRTAVNIGFRCASSLPDETL